MIYAQHHIGGFNDGIYFFAGNYFKFIDRGFRNIYLVHKQDSHASHRQK